MLNLYLLRHSNAAENPPPGQSGDAARQLTAEGIEKARHIGRAFRRLGLTFDLVLASPAARARHTAELVAKELPTLPKVELLEDLWIGGQPRRIVDRLRRGSRPAREALLVGHEPDLGMFASVLLMGSPGLELVFKKGGVAKFSIDSLKFGRCAALEWWLTPRQLRAIAGVD
jgi:phosphohistidine phosphatase